ncbi:hypothetical protein GCM10009836_00690 [Pseudonocardia ailaonensis]|uniref:Leucine-binding protein domain-containing protein n=1 Tax=Pseudonocardia ailaonensis TaxID=367279 RepID=A0ABN2MH88_9PSEU
MRPTVSARTIATLAAALAVGLTACSAPGGRGSTATEPIVLEWIGSVSAGARAPQVPAAAEAAAAAINAQGGVGGRPIEIRICDHRNTAEGEAACAQDLARNNVIAMVGNQVKDTTTVVEASVKYKIANIGVAGVGSTDLAATSVTSFPIAVSAMSLLACPGPLQDAGASQIGTIALDTGGGATLVAGVQSVLGKLPGTTYTTGARVSYNENNLAAPVQTLLNAGSTGAVTALAQPQLISTLSSGNGRITVCSADGVVTAADLKGLGKAADGFLIASPVPPASLAGVSGADGKRYVDEMDAFYASSKDEAAAPDQRNGSALSAWMAVHAFAKVAGGLPQITRESVTDAFSKTTDLNFPGLLAAPIDYTRTTAVPNLARLTNPLYSGYRWDAAAGNYVATGKAYNVISLLQGRS